MRLLALIVFVISIVQPTATSAQCKQGAVSQSEDYKVYEAARDLGTRMFGEFMKKNGLALRTAIILTACSKHSQASAVEAKIVDRQFVAQIDHFVKTGEFRDLPCNSILHTQSVANSLVAGYQIGYQDAVGMTINDKAGACGAATESANRLLR
jgi:hypothetical protein